MLKRPTIHDTPVFYHKYIDLIPEDETITDFLSKQNDLVVELYKSLEAEKLDYRYADEKWTVKEVLHHICDMERVFQYRALCFARSETSELPGADENHYQSMANTEQVSIQVLLNEFQSVRAASLSLIETFGEHVWENKGVANRTEMRLTAIPFIMAGHCAHHMKILETHYACPPLA